MWVESSMDGLGAKVMPDACKRKNCSGAFRSHRALVKFCDVGQPAYSERRFMGLIGSMKDMVEDMSETVRHGLSIRG